jgi:hypothetical protein
VKFSISDDWLGEGEVGQVKGGIGETMAADTLQKLKVSGGRETDPKAKRGSICRC